MLKQNCCNAPDDAYASSCTASDRIRTAKQLTSYQNSSASRRFLPTSSAQSLVAQRKFNSPVVGQQADRFAKSTPVVSSTPFGKTASVRRTEDEIDAVVEERSSSSPPLPARLRFSSSLSRHRDNIDDASDEDEVADAGRPENIPQDDDDDLSHLLYLEKIRGTKTPQHSERENGLHQAKAIPRKRQRISGTGTARDDVIAISSSPSPEPTYSAQVSDDEDIQNGFSHGHSGGTTAEPLAPAYDEFTSSPTGPVSPLGSSKFRIPTHAVFPTPISSTKLSFKLPQVQSAATLGQSASSSLPDAFSPSRRRGKKDYIPGGAADTVRSWVLALATEESKAGQTYTERFKVVEMTDGYREDRCELVRDENGRRWLLMNENAKVGGSGSDSELQKVTVGRSVGIRVGNTALSLQLDRRKQLDKDSPNEIENLAEEWSVGTKWDLLD
jgi:hypothetical protein